MQETLRHAEEAHARARGLDHRKRKRKKKRKKRFPCTSSFPRAARTRQSGHYSTKPLHLPVLCPVWDCGDMLMRQSCWFREFVPVFLRSTALLWYWPHSLVTTAVVCACWFCCIAPRAVFPSIAAAYSWIFWGDVFWKMLLYSMLAQQEIHAQASVYRAFSEFHTFSS